MSRIPLFLLLLGGCASSYATLAYDVTGTSSGGSSEVVSGGDRTSGHVAVGFGSTSAAMEVVVAGHDLKTSDDPWLAASGGLELSLRLARLGPATLFAHGGPMRGLLFDASAGTFTWGAGLAWGAGLTLGHGGVHLVIDARGEEQWFAGTDDEMTLGNCSLRTLSIGLSFGRR